MNDFDRKHDQWKNEPYDNVTYIEPQYFDGYDKALDIEKVLERMADSNQYKYKYEDMLEELREASDAQETVISRGHVESEEETKHINELYDHINDYIQVTSNYNETIGDWSI